MVDSKHGQTLCSQVLQIKTTRQVDRGCCDFTTFSSKVLAKPARERVLDSL